jgi:hypothetical protein
MFTNHRHSPPFNRIETRTAKKLNCSRYGAKSQCSNLPHNGAKCHIYPRPVGHNQTSNPKQQPNPSYQHRNSRCNQQAVANHTKNHLTSPPSYLIPMLHTKKAIHLGFSRIQPLDSRVTSRVTRVTCGMECRRSVAHVCANLRTQSVDWLPHAST